MPGRRQQPLKPHPAQPDGIPARWRAPQTCLHCQLPVTHQIHTLPDTPPDVRAEQNRRLGERDEETE